MGQRAVLTSMTLEKLQALREEFMNADNDEEREAVKKRTPVDYQNIVVYPIMPHGSAGYWKDMLKKNKVLYDKLLQEHRELLSLSTDQKVHYEAQRAKKDMAMTLL